MLGFLRQAICVRSFSRLRAILVSFVGTNAANTSGIYPFANNSGSANDELNGVAYNLKECNNFLCPFGGDPIGRDNVTLQLSIGGTVVPIQPIRSMSEAFFRLWQTLRQSSLGSLNMAGYGAYCSYEAVFQKPVSAAFRRELVRT